MVFNYIYLTKDTSVRTEYNVVRIFNPKNRRIKTGIALYDEKERVIKARLAAYMD